VGILNLQNCPADVMNAELWREARASEIDQKADQASIRVNQCMPLHLRRQSSMRGKFHTLSPVSAVMLLSLRRSTRT
jgi:hypothetical protein